ncbi:MULTISPECIES: F-box protein, partial [unclassified Endozoicomonas]
MDRINPNSGSTHSTTPDQSISKQASTGIGVSAGRKITVSDKGELSLLNLPSLTQLKIIGCLRLKDIARLKQVCTYFREVIEGEDLLAKAWYRRFSSPHQSLLKTVITAKSDEQLSRWVGQFTNDQVLTKSLIERRNNVDFPALVFFNNTDLM